MRDDLEAALVAYGKARQEPTERYERRAELFAYDTGYMAPGKDRPAEMGGEAYDSAARDTWAEWTALHPND